MNILERKLELTPIKEKIVDSCLRWFGHIQRRPIEALVRKLDYMENNPIIGSRGRLENYK